MFKSPFSFYGRIRRTEYGLTFIIYFIFYLLALFMLESQSGLVYLGLLMVVPLIWFAYAQGAKRCHDMGRSGWWQLIPFYFFVMLFVEGDHRENDYGPSPKGGDIVVDQREPAA